MTVDKQFFFIQENPSLLFSSVSSSNRMKRKLDLVLLFLFVTVKNCCEFIPFHSFCVIVASVESVLEISKGLFLI